MTLSYEEFVSIMKTRARNDIHLLRMLSTFEWSTDDYEECLYFNLIYTITQNNDIETHKIMNIYERMINDVIHHGHGHILDRLVINRDRLFKFWYIKLIIPNC